VYLDRDKQPLPLERSGEEVDDLARPSTLGDPISTSLAIPGSLCSKQDVVVDEPQIRSAAASDEWARKLGDLIFSAWAAILFTAAWKFGRHRAHCGGSPGGHA
jgi:hypothetical protein